MIAPDLAAVAASARSLLFVPGDRPERIRKARDAGADLAIVDLEDAVTPAARPEARGHVADALATDDRPLAVRINAVGTADHGQDLEVVRQRSCIVMVAKAEDPGRLEALARTLPDGAALIALVETAAGVLAAAGIAQVAGVTRLAFGSFDLAAELGVDPADATALAWTRSQLVLASAAAGIAPPVDGVTAAVDEPEVVTSEVAMAARLGFTGKLCIHPRQVPIVHTALRPSEDELRWARRVVDAVAPDGIAVVDGRMVDRPVVERARRLLASAEQD